MEAELDVGGNARGNAEMQDFHYALQKLRKDCENFAGIAKFSLCTFFRYHRESYYA